VSLLFQVAAYLRDRNIPAALIGGDALAVHGVPRATLDQDLLAVDARVLDAATWTGLMEPSLDIDIRKAMRTIHSAASYASRAHGRSRRQRLAAALHRSLETALTSLRRG
jgi:hypothetical protein